VHISPSPTNLLVNKDKKSACDNSETLLPN